MFRGKRRLSLLTKHFGLLLWKLHNLHIPQGAFSVYQNTKGWHMFRSLYDENEIYVMDYGECGANGDNLMWHLTSDSVLTISGKGAMANYSYNTTLPSYHFYGNNLKTLVIGDSVTSIGNFAFNSCSGFTGTLTIPESVVSIDNSAFSFCNGFTGTLKIPESVVSIGNDAFVFCRGFTGVLTIPDSVRSIGSTAFAGCTGLTEISIGNSVTVIESNIFNGCSNLKELSIGNSVTVIDIFAFSYCEALTSIRVKAKTPPQQVDSTYTFYHVPADIPVYVPCFAYSDYINPTGFNT